MDPFDRFRPESTWSSDGDWSSEADLRALCVDSTMPRNSGTNRFANKKGYQIGPQDEQSRKVKFLKVIVQMVDRFWIASSSGIGVRQTLSRLEK